ncbi:hypothetical protein [Sphingomonas sp. Leaf38]|uniref:hypothetical protein n=1 Tax=Sphingomonas sp. Leaf38 TaxID=1736217 RepID=UPI0006F730D9|nr:hypothetical protein [Sphingomonas sp. Leaf38]KQN29687.1 hypothetical protein ASE88_12555 [Sphingomonas sp. Leaf38]
MMQDILQGAALAVFGSAGATAVGVLVATLATQWTRICLLALGNVEPGHTPLPPRPFAEAAHS